MGCRDNSRIHEELYMGCNAYSHVFNTYVSIIYRKSCTYVGFLKENHVHIKKDHFQGISGNFQTLVSSGKFYLIEIYFQWCRDKVKLSYKTQYMGPPS